MEADDLYALLATRNEIMRGYKARLAAGALAVAVCWGLASCSGSEEPVPPTLDEVSDVTWGEQVFGSDEFEEAEKTLEEGSEPRSKERSQLWKRGKYLVHSVAACGVCHGARNDQPDSALSGGRLMRDSAGEVAAANITPHPAVGIGGWQVKDIVKALREGLGSEGEPISLELHYGYRWMADRDARAIAVYLQSLKPVNNEVPPRDQGVLGFGDIGLSSSKRRVKGYVPQPAQTESAAYGMYLSRFVAGCDRCHRSEGGWFSSGTPFAGTENADKDDAAESVSPRGPDIRAGEERRLAEWSVDDLVAYLRTGTTPGGEQTSAADCPWPFFKGMTEADKKAIALYLKQL